MWNEIQRIRKAAKLHAVAVELGVPLGTYRRQLGEAVAFVVDELWRREIAAPRE